jgi:signal peptidase I
MSTTVEPGEPSASGDAVIAEPAPVVLERSAEEALAERRAARRRLLWTAIWELFHDVSIAVVFCFFLITFVAQAFRVQGPSMMPLLHDGERIVVNKLLYRLAPIERGDVVVFWYPHDPSVSFIKRVIALPGERVEIRQGRVFVNGTELQERYLQAEFRDDTSMPPTEVKKGYYFVLGDHRNQSNDSRAWGEVPEKYIYAKAFFRFWPLRSISKIR